MQIKQVHVPLEKAVDIFDIIAKALKYNINTQVYVACPLFNELFSNGDKYHVYQQNYQKTIFYNSGETWYSLTEGTIFDKPIANASFINNCSEYMQLVQFQSKEVKEYTHFAVGFKKLLLIEVKE